MSLAIQRAVLHRNPEHDHGRAIKRRPAAIVPVPVVIRPAVAADAPAIHRLIVDHASEGRLLARSLDEVTVHIDRFVVAGQGNRVIGGADLAPLGASVAEVRSLVVDSTSRANGIGRKLLDRLTARAEGSGFDLLCAFTHSPAYFVHAGFSIVPHAWVPEKIDRDCRSCPRLRRCGQYAVVLPLQRRGSFLGVSPVNG